MLKISSAFFILAVYMALSSISELVAPAMASAGLPTAPSPHIDTLQNVHLVGEAKGSGQASGDDGAMHWLVGVYPSTPVAAGVTMVSVTVTHNEPSRQLQDSVTRQTKQFGQIDVTCPTVEIVTIRGHRDARAEECTFNHYTPPAGG